MPGLHRKANPVATAHEVEAYGVQTSPTRPLQATIGGPTSVAGGLTRPSRMTGSDDRWSLIVRHGRREPVIGTNVRLARSIPRLFRQS